MKNDYAPYLLYQVARFGALTFPQMQQICHGKCKRSALYTTIASLKKARLLSKIENDASGTRAYFATKEGRSFVFGPHFPAPSGIRASELDHTIGAAQVIMDLSQYENVTGIAMPFEMRPEELSKFCYNRVPDGILRLTQGDQNFELAVELETSVKATDGVRSVLERYWQSVRRGMECYGVLIVATSPQILQRYTHALKQMPAEFSERVKLLEGIGLNGINPQAFGEKNKAIPRVLELTRTESMDEITYTSVKSELFLAQTTFTGPTPMGSGPHIEMEVTI